jgi:hypothetical protein
VLDLGTPLAELVVRPYDAYGLNLGWKPVR